MKQQVLLFSVRFSPARGRVQKGSVGLVEVLTSSRAVPTLRAVIGWKSTRFSLEKQASSGMGSEPGLKGEPKR